MDSIFQGPVGWYCSVWLQRGYHQDLGDQLREIFEVFIAWWDSEMSWKQILVLLYVTNQILQAARLFRIWSRQCTETDKGNCKEWFLYVNFDEQELMLSGHDDGQLLVWKMTASKEQVFLSAFEMTPHQYKELSLSQIFRLYLLFDHPDILWCLDLDRSAWLNIFHQKWPTPPLKGTSGDLLWGSNNLRLSIQQFARG